MLTISLQQLRAANACADKLADWTAYIGGDSSPQPYARLIECPALGPSEWYWATRCLTDSERRAVYLSTMLPAAKRALALWERAYPEDERPRLAVEAAELALRDPSAQPQQVAAAIAVAFASAFADAAASAFTDDAAYAAAARRSAPSRLPSRGTTARACRHQLADAAFADDAAELAQQRQDWINTLRAL